MIKKLIFGERLRGIWASEDNPIRDGFYVETIRRGGRVNAGTYYRLTNKRGKFWEYPADSVVRLAEVVGETPITDAVAVTFEMGFPVLNCTEVVDAEEMRKLEKKLADARAGLQAVDDLIGDSKGVACLHLNGDVALWDELRTGGYYEDWLIQFDKAIEVI